MKQAELYLSSMNEAPKDGSKIVLFKDVGTALICHVARWEDGSDENFEQGWWAYVRHSATQELVDDLGQLLGWLPVPKMVDVYA